MIKLKDIHYFKDKKIINIKKEEDKILVDTPDKKYKIVPYDRDFHPLLESKKEWFDHLQSMESSIVPIEEVSTMGENSYYIKECVEDVKYQLTQEEQFLYGIQFGKFLHEFHKENLMQDAGFWSTVYNYKINMVDHEYGLGNYRGSLDYMVWDYIRNNKYLISHRPWTNILYLRSFHDISITRDGRFEFDLFNQSYKADPYFEFRNINIRHYKIEYFIIGILKGYFNRIPRNFYKVLALYTLVEAWGNSFVEYEPYEDVVHMKTEELVEEYDHFSTVIPKWMREVDYEV
ncbi:MAG: hypothetical protein Q4P25_04475 [Tissierellia bacterium]|nr:hypothetical protein [Tissierellia bacterium]